MTEYVVRRRQRPTAFPPYTRPWELLRDGVPVGFYTVPGDAIAASPEKPYVVYD